MNKIDIGMPSHAFFDAAWASEPLTTTLKETDVMFALPNPDVEISLVAKNDQDQVIGQCSANKAETYWSRINGLDFCEKNESTQNFIKIHQKAVVIEKLYLQQNGLSMDNAWHNAGVAVLPEYRRKKIGFAMVGKQIELGLKNSMSVLFYEATNRHSAAIVEKLGLVKLAEFKYSDLSIELNDSRLATLDDSFSVWCLKGVRS